jgi:hypothetical protein
MEETKYCQRNNLACLSLSVIISYETMSAASVSHCEILWLSQSNVLTTFLPHDYVNYMLRYIVNHIIEDSLDEELYTITEQRNSQAVQCVIALYNMMVLLATKLLIPKEQYHNTGQGLNIHHDASSTQPETPVSATGAIWRPSQRPTLSASQWLEMAMSHHCSRRQSREYLLENVQAFRELTELRKKVRARPNFTP